MSNILVVEDEVVEAMNLKKSLQSMGYNVLHIASSGREAITQARNLKPDLILMDVILEGDMDGIEASKVIKNFKIPVIFLTALPDDTTVQRALLSEPYGYLIKPFDNRKLKIAIEVALYKNGMEKKYKKSQKNYYETIFENTGTATAIIEEDKTISLVNMEFSNFTGYKKEEIEHKMKWTEFIFPEDIGKMEEYHKLRRINPEYAPRNYESRIVDRDGVIKPACLTVAMIPDTKKSMVSILDMTELEKSKIAIEKSQEKFKTIFENAAEAIILLDRYGTIIEANDRIEHLSGFKKEELIGQKFMKLLPKVKIECKKALKAFKDLVRGNGLKQVEWSLKNKEGEDVFFRAHPSVIKNEDKIDGLVIILEDITERKKAEDSLKTSLEEKELLLREIHHRVKNNLQIISSLLSLQRLQVDDLETADILRECQGRVRTMAMVHENLYQSKDIRRVDFEEYLKKLLRNIFNSYHVDKGVINLKIQVECTDMGIETAMPCGLIINELATNSIKHAFPHGEKGNILVNLKQDNDSYVLNYEDDGVGLPKNINPENSKKLGLMVVKTLANQLNAKVKIDRNNGTKYTFKFKELYYQSRT
ncbi:MAG: PAS domain S-box protein [Methanobacteriaceae archaeon]|nr:PAS domain S-box protein [Methanobacteriaceae archaeon]